MLTSTVLAYFDHKHAKVAEAIGIYPAAIYQWGKLVPELSARRLDAATNGELRFDPNLYGLPARLGPTRRRRSVA